MQKFEDILSCPLHLESTFDQQTFCVAGVFPKTFELDHAPYPGHFWFETLLFRQHYSTDLFLIGWVEVDDRLCRSLFSNLLFLLQD